MECSHKYILRKTEITAIEKMILLQLELLENMNGNIKKIDHKYNIKNNSNQFHLLQGYKYKVMSAIFHEGTTINQGHYISMIKKGKLCMQANNSNIKKKPAKEFEKCILISFRQILNGLLLK